MRKSLATAIAGVLCGVTVLTALPSELLAGPMSVTRPDKVALSSPVDQVYWRRYYRGYGYRYGYHRGYYGGGGALFAGAALGLLGAGIAAAAAPSYYYYPYGYGYPVYYGYPAYYSYPGYYYYGGW